MRAPYHFAEHGGVGNDGRRLLEYLLVSPLRLIGQVQDASLVMHPPQTVVNRTSGMLKH
jgi:hypothetical protein